ncbi:MAG TPA: hypothetical protein VE782_14075, partial [Myxococcaceae bacterium]|nr:hypothetical protein [Myxococcaceae bacterium]
MRVGIQGWGSEGDLRPLIALAGGLRRSGHEVRLVLTPVDGKDYSGLCRSLDVALRVVPERLDFTLDKVAEDAQSLDPLKVSRELVKRAFDPFVDQLYESARELCASADVLVWHYSCWYAKAAALKSGTPDAAVHFYPGLVPTRERPPGGLPNLGVLNPLLWRAARWMLDQFRQ